MKRLALLLAVCCLTLPATAQAVAPTLKLKGAGANEWTAELEWTPIPGATEYRLIYESAGGTLYNGWACCTAHWEVIKGWTEPVHFRVQTFFSLAEVGEPSNVVTFTFPLASNTKGKVRGLLDTGSYFDKYAESPFAPWIEARNVAVKAYPGPVGNKYPTLVTDPVTGYYDVWTEGGGGGHFLIANENAATAKTERERYNAKLTDLLAKGYKGIWNDDINFSGGNRPSSGYESTHWNEALKLLLKEQREAHPTAVISINSHSWQTSLSDATVNEAVSQANTVTEEWGVVGTKSADSGSAAAYKAFVETWANALHAKGIHIEMTYNWENTAVASNEYNLASYLLINDGGDYIGSQGTPAEGMVTAVEESGKKLVVKLALSNHHYHGGLLPIEGVTYHYPFEGHHTETETTDTFTSVEPAVPVLDVGKTVTNWWPGYGTNLGAAEGALVHEGACTCIWKRSFSGGVVYVVDPGAAEQEITLSKTMTNANGETVTSPLHLKGAHGAVLH